MQNRKGAAAAIGVACALFAVACSSSSKSSSSTTAAASNTTAAASATTAATSGGSGPWGWPGDSTQGYLAPNEPDVNKDGKVVIGVISPGDTHDHGYYESFV